MRQRVEQFQGVVEAIGSNEVEYHAIGADRFDLIVCRRVWDDGHLAHATHE